MSDSSKMTSATRALSLVGMLRAAILRGMGELVFLVEEAEEGGYTACCLGESIFTQADSVEGLRENVRDAVRCHFDDDARRIIRLHFVRDEVFAA